MNQTELKIARVRRGIKTKTVARAIDKTLDSYCKKENGRVKITLHEAAAITNVLCLTLSEFITIFFDGILPFCKYSENNYNFSRFAYPLRSARARAGISTQRAASALNLTVPLYLAREKGKSQISLNEAGVLSKLYGLSIDEFNDIFFRKNLPFCKVDLDSYNNSIAQNGGEINVKESYESLL